MFKRLLTGVLAAAVAVTSFSVAAFSVSADSDFTDLDKDAIVEAMSPAWNLGNQLEASSNKIPSETVWGNPTITQETFKIVKDAGFKAVRIPVSYLAKIGNGPDYTIDASWLNRIEAVVDMAIDEGLYVIMNIHGDGYYTVTGGWLLCGEENQTEIKEKFAAVWKQIANRFADYDEHLVFESMNEVFDNAYGNPNPERYQNINNYNQIFVDTVRQTSANNAKRWLLVPGWNTNINYTTGNYGFQIPTDNYRDSSIPDDEQRIMISVHYYDPWDFCGQEDGKTTTWGTDAQLKTLKDQFIKCYKSFVLNGYPVVIGEYGSIDKTSYDSNNTASRVKYANEVCKAARSMGMVPVYWDNGWNGNHGFGLFNRNNKTVTQPEIIAGIMSAYEGEAEPAPEIIEPITKDEALAVINWSQKSDGAVSLASGTVDETIAGATKVRVTFDCAEDVSFNQYAYINIISTIDDTTTKTAVPGNSDLTGATMLRAEADLAQALQLGSTYDISSFTASWRNASDYIYLIRTLEFLDAQGNVLKTVAKEIVPPTTEPTTVDEPTTSANTTAAATTTKAAGTDSGSSSTTATDKPVNTGVATFVGITVFMLAGAMGAVALKKRRK